MSVTMSMGDLNQFPIEKSSQNPIPLSILILGLAQFLTPYIIPFCVKRIYGFFSKPKSFFQSQIELQNNLKSPSGNKRENGNLCREDVETVMGSLGIFCNLEGEKIQERFVSDEFSKLFEENEPSLDEVKGAFDVFDENRDGFIDSKELQRVLCVLGFKDGLEIDNCRKMIKAFDENGDGRIDFNEFVKFMENTFC